MINKELIDWFNNYFDNCYYVKHDDFPESVFMFYDINYVRQKKLAKLEGIDYVEKTDITGVCLFHIDYKYKYFNCDYDVIWKYLKDNYLFEYTEFNLFIKERLFEHKKLDNITVMNIGINIGIRMEELTSELIFYNEQYYYKWCELLPIPKSRLSENIINYN